MTPSNRLRLFVAVTVPPAHLEKVASASAPLRERWPRARWMEPSNQHVTLKFLGSTDPNLLEEVRSVISETAARRPPATVALGSLGVFPSRTRARVLWLGLEDPTGTLAALAEHLAVGFEPLGFPAEKRAFRAHLTLARFREPERIRPELLDLGIGELAPFEVASLELFRSHLHPRGARYEVLESFPLTGTVA